MSATMPGGAGRRPYTRPMPPPVEPRAARARLPRVARLLLATVAVVAAVVALVPAPAAAGEEEGVGRMFVFSVPGLTWSESADHPLPELDAFFADAALADLAPRSVAHRSTPGEAYLTISAGTRATSDELVDGQVFSVEARAGDSAAGEVFQRRTGVTPRGEFVALGWPTLDRANDRQPYDAVLGLLGERLRDEGFRTAVIADADGSDLPEPTYARQAGLALSDTEGVLETGALGAGLTVEDPSRAFGLRLDTDRVVEAFRAAWCGPDGR